ncbi:hypothetical protein Y017_07485 [Alcanivorax sp. 97CO-5]|jgi:hypothetical protein|nr:hypothetical protein Y017_07485 [Alcanivorax sp. 97CO-5]PKG02344.1 hypothetical protein Y019_03305 [Alcanivorax sp. 97CO-6]
MGDTRLFTFLPLNQVAVTSGHKILVSLGANAEGAQRLDKGRVAGCKADKAGIAKWTTPGFMGTSGLIF